MGYELGLAFQKADLVVLFRLLAAALAGGFIGWNRFRAGKPAGVGTHALVALGAALFLVVPARMAPPTADGISRVIQGIATGVGFLGAGEIFRSATQGKQVQGLTSAAAIWATAGVGVIAGCGSGFVVLSAIAIILLILVVAPRLERRFSPKKAEPSRSEG